MRISAITTTFGRPEAMVLAGRWLARQTRQPDEWIVSSSSREPPGLANFRENLVDGLQRCTGDLIVVVEDDDYYRPDHIEKAVEGIRGALLFGCGRQVAYDLRRRRYLDRVIRFSPLCAVAFRREFVPTVSEIALSMNPYLELAMWSRCEEGAAARSIEPTVIGMKGMPGSANVSSTDDIGKKWVDDPDAEKLREWLGEDVSAYEGFLAARAEAVA